MGGVIKGIGNIIGVGSGATTKQAPQNPGFDMTAFTNDAASNQQQQNIQNQLQNIGSRTIPTINGATLPNQTLVGGAQVAPATTMGTTQINAMQNTPGAQVAPAAQANNAQINPMQVNQDRMQQEMNIRQLAQQAAGQGGPGLTLAQNQLKAGTQANLQGALAAGTSLQGLNPSTSQRNILDAMTNANQQAALQSSNVAAQAQQAAQSQLTGAIAGQGAQDLNLGSTNAGLAQQTNLANQAATNTAAGQQANLSQANQQYNASTNNNASLQQAAYQQQSLANNQAAMNAAAAQQAGLNEQSALEQGNIASNENLGQANLTQNANLANQNAALNMYGQANQATQGLDAQTLALIEANQQNAMQGQQLGVQQGEAYSGMQNALNQQAVNNSGNFLGNLFNGIGTAAVAASDKRAKKNIKAGDRDIQAFLDHLKAQSYEYKDPSDGDGEYVSPMAQDMEKSKVGRSMVTHAPDGKKLMVANGHTLGTLLASLAHLNDRLASLEKGA